MMRYSHDMPDKAAVPAKPVKGRLIAQGQIGGETVLTVAVSTIDYNAPHEPVVIILD